MAFLCPCFLLSGYNHLLTLELLPFHPSNPLNPKAPISSATYHAPLPPSSTIHLTLPERVSNRLALAPSRVLQQTRSKWLAAFEQSFLQTVRGMSGVPDDRVVSVGFEEEREISIGELEPGENDGNGEYRFSAASYSDGTASVAIPRSPSEQHLQVFQSTTVPTSPSNLVGNSNFPASTSTRSLTIRHQRHRTPSAEFARDREEKAWWAMRMRQTKAEMAAAAANSHQTTSAFVPGGLLGFGDVDADVEAGVVGGVTGLGGSGAGLGGGGSGRMRSRSRFGGR